MGTIRTYSSPPSAGLNLSLGDTASHPFLAMPCSLYIEVSAPLSNTAPCYVGRATGVTSGATGTGIELLPGQSKKFFVADASELWGITATATQNLHYMPF